MTESGHAAYSDWKSWKAEDFGECRQEEAAYFAEELRRSRVGDLRGKRVIEIGFGNGAFATWARKQGADYAGTELIAESQALARQSGIGVLDDTAPLAGQGGLGRIDLAVAFDVFEHIEPGRLCALLDDLRACLRPDGCVVGMVPSGDSPFSRAIQYGDLTHRSVLGSSTIRQLAASASLPNVTAREPVLPMRGAGCRALRRGLVHVARRVLSSFLCSRAC